MGPEMGARAWAGRLWLAAAALGALAILGFYASRLLMPLPIFAADEAAYLIRAIYPPGMVAADSSVAPLNNGAHLSVIRAAYALAKPLGASFIVVDRIADAAAYLAGLALLWRTSMRRIAPPKASTERWAFALIAIAFPYYRFAFSNLAEGLYVGVLVLFCLATARWYRSRPLLHAVVGGALGAALVLVKPNGVAALAALAVLAVIEAWASGGWRRLPLRILLFGVTFFAVGNLIQWAAEEPADHPLAFFVGDLYSAALGAGTPPAAARAASLTLASMTAAMALLAGAPVIVGLAEIAGRWRSRRGRFVLEERDLLFLLLVLTTAATLVMVAVFATKIAFTPSETNRLWGRYFEFFVPLLWLAAAPALTRPMGRGVALASGAVMFVGLSGLLASLQAGIVLFPWDSSALTAFYAPDPVRAPLHFAVPYRALAAAAGLLAAGAVAFRLRPAQAGLGLILALSVLSTLLDQAWQGPVVKQRDALARDIRAIHPILPSAGDMVVLAPNPNEGHLLFLGLEARPLVLVGPVAQTLPAYLASAQAVIVAGPEAPPGAGWTRTFKGEVLSVFRPAAAAP